MQRKILEAYTRDVGRGVARIDYDTMDEMNCSTGDVCLITGKENSTPVKILPLYPSDEDKGVIRIDGLIRKNTKVTIGQTCEIEKIETIAAVTFQAFPISDIPPIDSRYLVDALESVAIQQGQVVMIPYFGGRLEFKITTTEPERPVVVTQKTIASIVEHNFNPELKMILNYVDETKATVSKTSFEKIKELIKDKQFDEMQKIIADSREVIEGLDQFKKDVTDLYNTDFGQEES